MNLSGRASSVALYQAAIRERDAKLAAAAEARAAARAEQGRRNLVSAFSRLDTPEALLARRLAQEAVARLRQQADRAGRGETPTVPPAVFYDDAGRKIAAFEAAIGAQTVAAHRAHGLGVVEMYQLQETRLARLIAHGARA